MEPTLDEALLKLFGEGPRPPEATVPDVDTPDVDRPEETPFKSVQELAQQARDIYDRANEQLKEGNWAGYGESIEKLNVIISELEAAAN